MKTKKEKTAPITANELFGQHFNGLHYEDITPDKIEKYAIAFAKLKVAEALEETSKHFKNPENVSHVKNHYKLDKIV